MDYQLITMGVIAISNFAVSTYLDAKRRNFLDYFNNQRVPELVASLERLESIINETSQSLLNKIDNIEEGRR